MCAVVFAHPFYHLLSASSLPTAGSILSSVAPCVTWNTDFYLHGCHACRTSGLPHTSGSLLGKPVLLLTYSYLLLNVCKALLTAASVRESKPFSLTMLQSSTGLHGLHLLGGPLHGFSFLFHGCPSCGLCIWDPRGTGNVLGVNLLDRAQEAELGSLLLGPVQQWDLLKSFCMSQNTVLFLFVFPKASFEDPKHQEKQQLRFRVCHS